jgi:hypothetical protein
MGESEHRSWLLLDDLHRASQSALLPFCVECFEHAPHWLRHPHSHLFAGHLPSPCFCLTGVFTPTSDALRGITALQPRCERT